MVQTGESGTLSFPSWINAPGFGTWLIDSKDDAASLRSECRRAAGFNLIELKVGESSEKNGLHRLLNGRHEATFTFRPLKPPTQLKRKTPEVIKRALERTHFVAPTFRADLGSLSNSGASMGCPICADTWTSVLPKLDISGGLKGGLSGQELL